MSQVDVPWVAKSHFRGVVVGWDSECRQTVVVVTLTLALTLTLTLTKVSAGRRTTGVAT